MQYDYNNADANRAEQLDEANDPAYWSKREAANRAEQDAIERGERYTAESMYYEGLREREEDERGYYGFNCDDEAYRNEVARMDAADNYYYEQKRATEEAEEVAQWMRIAALPNAEVRAMETSLMTDMAYYAEETDAQRSERYIVRFYPHLALAMGIAVDHFDFPYGAPADLYNNADPMDIPF